ncbi:hypothetical protein ACR0ST_08080 [Aliidiomarina sp. Khilg15.8]
MRHLFQSTLYSLFLLFVPLSNATTLTGAFEQYRDDNFVEAYQQFEGLLPLANATAALQMSLMTLDEEGTEYDPAMAFALATMATAWEHPDGPALVEHIEPHLTAAQRQQAIVYRDDIAARQQVHQFDTQTVRLTPLREKRTKVLEYAEPEYPILAAAKGNVGWFRAIVLVTREGGVAAMDDAGSSVTPEFEPPSYRAIKRWRYEPLELPEPHMVQMDYTINRRNTSEHARRKYRLESYLESLDLLWEPAQNGGSAYQYVLGQILTRATTLAQAESINYGKALPGSTAPSKQDFDIADKTVTWPQSWSGTYWLNTAARNGNRDAQWSLAVSQEEWMRYLISQGDVQAKTWHGAKLASRAINEEDRDYGRQLLREARDSGDETAIAVASHYFKDSE